MARMIGKTLRIRQCPYECCGDTRRRHSVKNEEEAFWRKEADDEIDGFERDHENGMCMDVRTGMGGCSFCYPEDYDYYDASELDGIKGVWTDTARLIY